MGKITSLILVFIMVLAVGCNSSSPPDSSNTTESRPNSTGKSVETGSGELVSDTLTVEGVGLGSSRTEVERVLGQPDKVERAPQQNAEFYHYMNRGLEIGVSGFDNRVRTIFVTSPSTVKTKAGVGIGGSLSDVTTAYGESDAKGIYNFGRIQGESIRLQVRSKDGKVTSLYFAWGYE